MKHVLVVAYYFPPMGLSGVQRVSKLTRYLPAYGWRPTVLTVEPGGYFAYDPSLLREVEEAGVEVVRTTSWDPTRFFGRRRTVALPTERRRRWLTSLSQLAFVPDNKVGWYPAAVRAGRRLLRDGHFDLVFSSAPPYTGHLVGAALSRSTGVPLVTDFRDDWVGNPRHVYPTSLHRWAHVCLERAVLRCSRLALTINEPIADALRERHGPAADLPEVKVVPQGFDPADFSKAPERSSDGRMRFVYAGVFYDAQTPDPFLTALARFVEERPEVRRHVEAVFVGLLPEASRALASRLGIDDLVRHEGYLSHDAAVTHLQAADVLWMTVGRRRGAETISTGKLFEYFGARKPILGLVPRGAARAMLQRYGAAVVTEPDDVGGIRDALAALYAQWREGRLPTPDAGFVSAFDRRAIAGDVAGLFDAVARPVSQPQVPS